MREYVVVYEEGPSSWGAYVPDLPGCFAVGKTRAEVEDRIRGAIEFHIRGMLADGDSVPPPAHSVGLVHVAA
jgi:predicted RNase H-like HicB family nuclease